MKLYLTNYLQRFLSKKSFLEFNLRVVFADH